jgi:hypothetical protein
MLSCIVLELPFKPAYMDGVKKFMEFVKGKYPEDSKIKCPCRKCVNQVLQHQQEVNDHIHIFGMSPAYTCWIHHGESLGAKIIESREEVVHHDRYYYDEGINLGEDDGQDDDRHDDHGVIEILADLYKSLEAYRGNLPKLLMPSHNCAQDQSIPGSHF